VLVAWLRQITAAATVLLALANAWYACCVCGVCARVPGAPAAQAVVTVCGPAQAAVHDSVSVSRLFWSVGGCLVLSGSSLSLANRSAGACMMWPRVVVFATWGPQRGGVGHHWCVARARCHSAAALLASGSLCGYAVPLLQTLALLCGGCCRGVLCAATARQSVRASLASHVFMVVCRVRCIVLVAVVVCVSSGPRSAQHAWVVDVGAHLRASVRASFVLGVPGGHGAQRSKAYKGTITNARAHTARPVYKLQAQHARAHMHMRMLARTRMCWRRSQPQEQGEQSRATRGRTRRCRRAVRVLPRALLRRP
jgi:hypothetical protein